MRYRIAIFYKEDERIQVNEMNFVHRIFVRLLGGEGLLKVLVYPCRTGIW